MTLTTRSSSKAKKTLKNRKPKKVGKRVSKKEQPNNSPPKPSKKRKRTPSTSGKTASLPTTAEKKRVSKKNRKDSERDPREEEKEPAANPHMWRYPYYNEEMPDYSYKTMASGRLPDPLKAFIRKYADGWPYKETVKIAFEVWYKDLPQEFKVADLGLSPSQVDACLNKAWTKVYDLWKNSRRGQSFCKRDLRLLRSIKPQSINPRAWEIIIRRFRECYDQDPTVQKTFKSVSNLYLQKYCSKYDLDCFAIVKTRLRKATDARMRRDLEIKEHKEAQERKKMEAHRAKEAKYWRKPRRNPPQEEEEKGQGAQATQFSQEVSFGIPEEPDWAYGKTSDLKTSPPRITQSRHKNRQQQTHQTEVHKPQDFIEPGPPDYYWFLTRKQFLGKPLAHMTPPSKRTVPFIDPERVEEQYSTSCPHTPVPLAIFPVYTETKAFAEWETKELNRHRYGNHHTEVDYDSQKHHVRNDRDFMMREVREAVEYTDQGRQSLLCDEAHIYNFHTQLLEVLKEKKKKTPAKTPTEPEIEENDQTDTELLQFPYGGIPVVTIGTPQGELEDTPGWQTIINVTHRPNRIFAGNWTEPRLPPRRVLFEEFFREDDEDEFVRFGVREDEDALLIPPEEWQGPPVYEGGDSAASQ